MSRLPLSLTLIPLHLVINGPVDKCVHAFPSALCMGLYNVFLTFGERQVNSIVCFCNPVILRFSRCFSAHSITHFLIIVYVYMRTYAIMPIAQI